MFFEKTWKIHQVAEIYRCSVRTLQYYDETGLLTPRRSESGQRLYTDADLDTLDTIFTLKQMGMRLKDIREALRPASPQQRAELLETQLAHVDAEIERLERTRARLLKNSADLREFLARPMGTPAVKTLPEQTYTVIPLQEPHSAVVPGGSDLLADFSPEGELLHLSRPDQTGPGTRQVMFVYFPRAESVPEQVRQFAGMCRARGYLLISPVRVRELSWLGVPNLYAEADIRQHDAAMVRPDAVCPGCRPADSINRCPEDN